MAHAVALKSLRREYKKHLEREQLLGSILETLSSGYNPNYQDMAVLEAVRGWQQLSGTGKSESGEENTADGGESTTPKEDDVEVGLWSVDEIERDLDGLLETDYISLLLAHEEHIRSPPSDSPRTCIYHHTCVFACWAHENAHASAELGSIFTRIPGGAVRERQVDRPVVDANAGDCTWSR